MWVLVLCLVLALEGSGTEPHNQSSVTEFSECGLYSEPWQVALDFRELIQCGAVLVHPYWVLTAAHCMGKDFYGAKLGLQMGLSYVRSRQLSYTDRRFPHPQFNMSLQHVRMRSPGHDFSHDIMLMQIFPPAEITESVNVIPLPTREPRVGSTCYVSGWGSILSTKYIYRAILQCAPINILSNAECALEHDQKVTEHMLCAGQPEDHWSTCLNDDGGPLICDGELQGIASWDPDLCDAFIVPGIYTKVLDYVPWIKKTIATYP